MLFYIDLLLSWLKAKFSTDTAIAYIRTYVPVGVGSAIAWVSVRTGFVIDADSLASLKAAFTGIVIALYYFLGNKLAARFPSLGFLVGSNKRPTYKE